MMLYNSKEDLRYAYSAGEIKMWENKLLTSRDFRHLISTENLEELSAILIEAGYQVPENKKAVFLDTDDFLFSNLADLYKRTKDLSFHFEITDLFLIRYDFRNFGALLKRKLRGNDVRTLEEEILVGLGLYGLKGLKDSFEKKNFEIYPAQAGEIFLKAGKITEREKIGTISRILDREYFAFALEVSAANSFCHYIFKVFVDFENLKNCLRQKKLGKDISFLNEFFIAGGRISKADFTLLFKGSLSLRNLLRRYSYQKAVSPKEEKEELDLIEKNLENFLIGVLKETKFSFIGLETVISYLLVKEMEIKNLRFVLQGRRAGLSAEDLLLYLRETYV